MCVSSLLHRNMTLQDRAEAGLAGFLSLDLFRMVAEEKAEELAVPQGSLFMSGQTCFNIQGVALSATVLTLCKDANWHPWKQGTCRLSELPVEEWTEFELAALRKGILCCRSTNNDETWEALEQ